MALNYAVEGNVEINLLIVNNLLEFIHAATFGGDDANFLLRKTNQRSIRFYLMRLRPVHIIN